MIHPTHAPVVVCTYKTDWLSGMRFDPSQEPGQKAEFQPTLAPDQFEWWTHEDGQGHCYDMSMEEDIEALLAEPDPMPEFAKQAIWICENVENGKSMRVEDYVASGKFPMLKNYAQPANRGA